MFGVQVTVDAAHFGPQYPLEGNRRHLDDRDLGPKMARRSRHLSPDPTRPDHDHRSSTDDGLSQGVEWATSAEIEDTRQG